MNTDPFDLQRFVTAQAASFEVAFSELQAGRKQSHWMWFIFPQLRGLGRSAAADYYGIAGLQEARAYLSHPVLAPRLALATRAVLADNDRTLRQIFGSPDDTKFHSSMTLFALASELDCALFEIALERWFGGMPDDATIALIGRMPSPGLF